MSARLVEEATTSVHEFHEELQKTEREARAFGSEFDSQATAPGSEVGTVRGLGLFGLTAYSEAVSMSDVFAMQVPKILRQPLGAPSGRTRTRTRASKLSWKSKSGAG